MSNEGALPVDVREVGTASGEESACEMIWPTSGYDKPKPNQIAHQHTRKKRYHSSSFSHSGINGLTIDGIPSDLRSINAMLHRVQLTDARLPYGKNSRKSRNGRKLPNKRGGKNHEDLTDVLDEIELDPRDPDYDSDDAPVVLDELRVQLSDEAFEKLVCYSLNDFFEHGITQEVINALSDVNIAQHQLLRLPLLAITQAIQHRQSQCELTSELLSAMYGKILTPVHIDQGFQVVLNELGDLVIDAPRAPEYIGRFIARAMADDILSPKFIEDQKAVFSKAFPAKSQEVNRKTCVDEMHSFEENGTNPKGQFAVNRSGMRNLSDSSTTGLTFVETSASSGIGSASSLMTVATSHEVALDALSRASTFLTLRHAFARMDNVWGVPTGPKANSILKSNIRRLLSSYMNSGDIDTTNEALLELDSPHFHHELVFQVVIMAIEMSTDIAQERAINLLDDLCKSAVLTSDQLAIGIRRIYAELPDLQLDVPNAYSLMERFVLAATKTGFMPKKYLEDIPSKHRKRFISETHAAP